MKTWLLLLGFIAALWLKQRLTPDPLVEVNRVKHERWKRDILRQVENDLAAFR